MAAVPPNDTTGTQSAETKRALRSSGKRHADMQNGNFALHKAWRQARSDEHDDRGALPSASSAGVNRYVASERRAATKYTGPNQNRQPDVSEIEE